MGRAPMAGGYCVAMSLALVQALSAAIRLEAVCIAAPWRVSADAMVQAVVQAEHLTVHSYLAVWEVGPPERTLC